MGTFSIKCFCGKFDLDISGFLVGGVVAHPKNIGNVQKVRHHIISTDRILMVK
jgi:hypothetical protein